MKIKELINLTMRQLGIAPTDDGDETDVLKRCYDIVENDIATGYSFLFERKEAEVKDGRVYFKDLYDGVIKVLAVKDTCGNRVEYTVFPEFCEVGKEQEKVVIEYAYSPRVKSAESEAEFSSVLPNVVFVYGMASEYCMARGDFEEAVLWHKKYKDALIKNKPVQKGKYIKTWRWV